MKLSILFKLSILSLSFSLSSVVIPRDAHADFSSSAASQISVGIDVNGDAEAPSGETLEPVAPANGNFIVFASTAKNLTSDYLSGDTNYPTNIYRYSDTDGIQLLSKGENGALPQNNGAGATSLAPSVSELLPDGSYVVAFQSDGTNMITDYTTPDQFSNPYQIYLYSSKLNRNILISFQEGSTTTGSSRNSYNPTVALLGTTPIKFRVCFEASANDLLDGGATGASEFGTIFCRIVRFNDDSISVEDASRLIDNPSGGSLHRPFLSQDGKSLVFSSKAEIITSISPNGFEQIYHHVFKTGVFSLISHTQDGAAAKGNSTYPSTTHKGNLVAFRYSPPSIGEGSADLESLEGATRPVIVLGKKDTGDLTQINASENSTASDGSGFAGKIDSGGRFVIFSDSGTNLLAEPSNSSQKTQVYVKDLKTSSIILASKNATGTEGSDNSGDNGDSINSNRQLPLTLVGTGQYKNSFMTSFISGADNLASIGDPDIYAPYLFATTITIPPRELTNRATIEAPANIEVLRVRRNGTQDVRISCEKFTSISASSSAQSNEIYSSAKNRVRYQIEIRKRGTRQRTIRIQRRNRATIRRLSPGRYTIRYRVRARSGDREIRSRYSPRKTIVIS